MKISSAFMRKALAVLYLSMSIASCKKTDKPEPNASNEKQILSFMVDSISGVINESTHTIAITLPSTYTLSAIQPTLTISEGATINPPVSLLNIDLTQPFIYTVTAENKTTVQYTVTGKTSVNTKNHILEFSIYTPDGFNPGGKAVVDTAHNIIYLDVNLDNGTGVLNAIKTVVSLPLGARSVPGTTDTVDFSKPVTYIITAENGDKRQYEVKIRNNANQIISYVLPIHGIEDGKYTAPWYDNSIRIGFPQDWSGLPEGNNRLFFALETDDLFLRKPIESSISNNATITPSLDMLQTWTNDIYYKVTSASGETAEWQVRVVRTKIIIEGMGYYSPRATWPNNTSERYLRYRSTSRIRTAWAVDTLTLNTTPLKVVSVGDANSWGTYTTILQQEMSFTKGIYRLKVELENGDEELTRYSFRIE
jgi:hypothetical protein